MSENIGNIETHNTLGVGPIGHFGDESFQSITCTGTDNLTTAIKRQSTLITQNNTTPKGTLVNSTTDTLKRNLGEETGHTAWFSRLSPLRHPARKRSGSILSTPEPARSSAGTALADIKFIVETCTFTFVYSFFVSCKICKTRRDTIVVK